MSQRLSKLSFSATVREGAPASSNLNSEAANIVGKFAVGDKGRKFIQDKSQRDLDLETKPTSQKSR